MADKNYILNIAKKLSANINDISVSLLSHIAPIEQSLLNNELIDTEKQSKEEKFSAVRNKDDYLEPTVFEIENSISQLHKIESKINSSLIDSNTSQILGKPSKQTLRKKTNCSRDDLRIDTELTETSLHIRADINTEIINAFNNLFIASIQNDIQEILDKDKADFRLIFRNMQVLKTLFDDIKKSTNSTKTDIYINPKFTELLNVYAEVCFIL